MTKAKKIKKSPLKQKIISKTTPLGFLTNRLYLGIGVFALAFLLYANTLGHGYTQDDAIVINDNMFTKEGVTGIPGILKYDTFYGFFKEAGKANLVSGGRYRPLTLVMFAIEYSLFGENPFIGHLINVILFGLTGVLLYLLILKLLSETKPRDFAVFVALVTAVLFVVHPIHTEVVANIKGRDEIVTLLGSLATLYLCLKAYFDGKIEWLAAAAGTFFLTLFSKENTVTFLAVIPMSLFFFTKSKESYIARMMIPLLVMTVVFLGIRHQVLKQHSGAEPVSVQQKNGGLFGSLTKEPMELMNNPFVKREENQYVRFTTAERSATICYTLGKYVQLLFFPHPLTHDYYPRHIEIMSWSDWQVLLSLLIYLAMIIYALTGIRRKEPLAYGILFYLLTLSIVSNIVFPIGTNMAERFMFMPSVGFCFGIAVLLYKFSGKLTAGTDTGFKKFKPGLGFLIIVSLLFGVKTISRNMAWESNYTLFTTDINTSKRSAKLLNAVGGELTTLSVKEENETKRKTMLINGIKHLEEALKIHPNYKNTYLLLGNAYNYLEQYESSITSYNRALKLDPNYKQAKNNLGITYRNAGRFYGEIKGDLQKSLEYLTEAYILRPDEYETVRLLGVAYGVMGNNPKAIEFFDKAARAEPENADAWYNLATAYFNAKDEVKGNEFRQKALSINPELEKERSRQRAR